MPVLRITNILHFLALQNLPKTYRWHLSFFIFHNDEIMVSALIRKNRLEHTVYKLFLSC